MSLLKQMRPNFTLFAVGVVFLSLACTVSAQCSATSCSACVSQGCQWCYSPTSGAAATCIPTASACAAGTSCGITTCPANPQTGIFALKQANVAQLQSMVRSMSTPSSAQYGQWMTRQAVLNIIAPPSSAQTAVVNWINSITGVQTVTNKQDAVYFTATPEATVQMFGSSVCPMLTAPPAIETKYGANGKRLAKKTPPRGLGTTLDAIPSNIAQYIDIWELLTTPPASQPNAYSTFGGQPGYSGTCPNPPGALATPPFYRQLYNMGSMGVTNPLTNLSTQLNTGSPSYATQDMQSFASLYNVQLGTVTSQPYYLPTGSPEASLDMETSTAVANGTQTVWWWAPGTWVYTMANTIFVTSNAPIVSEPASRSGIL